MPYLAIKIDIVRSRKVADRQKLQEQLFHAADQANDLFTPAIAAQFTVTHGDEVQGLLCGNQTHKALAICEHFVDALAPQRVRFGVGLGDLATQLQPHAIGMDGEAWYLASDAIGEAHRQRKVFVMKGPYPTAHINAMVDYLLTHRSLWSENQREAVQYLGRLGSQQLVAMALGISQAAVSKRLAGCLWDQYSALRDAVIDQLRRTPGESD